MADVEWTRRATKQWLALPLPDRARIAAAVDGLEAWPACRGIKALSGRDGYRLRVGRFRVLFTVRRGAPVVVRIEEVKKRNERTYSASNH